MRVKANRNARRNDSGQPERHARASSSIPFGGHRKAGPPGGTGRAASGEASTSSRISPITARNASELPAAGGITNNDRITPRRAGISEKRHDRPARSGIAPAGAGVTANSPRFMAASAQASPPPENMA